MTTAVETKLYVTNFPSSATRQQLQQFFSRFGRVQECAIMWNSYAFVHYATMEEARRALDQSNGAMFLNRKLIVQLSTSRFRPQPKETNTSISQSSSKQFISNHLNEGSKQQTTYLTYSDLLFRPSSSLSQDINNYYSNISINPMKINKNLKTDIGINGEIPKLYCTNLPDNCKANDLQNLFSSFGHVIDCVILWDYYAFITYKTFAEAERALIALNGFIWKDRHLIVEWSRASGRKQQQQISSTPPRLGSEISTPPSPRTRPSTLSASNNQFYGNTSPSFNQNLALISMIQQQQPFIPSIPNEFDSNHHHHYHLDLSPFIDTNSNSIFSSSSELNTPSSSTSISNVYQPSDIVALLEPSSSDISINNKSSINDLTNSLSSTCSSAALAQENLLLSLFNTFEPFNKFYTNDEQSSSSSSRYNHLSPLLTTAPDNNHYPMSYGHNISWR